MTIVHLSDLHLTAQDAAPRSEPKLFGKLTGMNAAFRTVLASAHVQSADRILITGDITDSGELAEWHVFWDAVNAANVGDRVILVPGNHDLCCLGLRLLLPGSDAAKADFARLLDGLAVGAVALPRNKYPAVTTIGETVAVFALNSNNLGNAWALNNAVGEIAHHDLVRFAGLLYQYRSVPVKIVALHHSPNIPEADTARRRGNRPMSDLQRMSHQLPEETRRALRLLCLSHRVRLIAHGHLHQKEDRNINGIRIIGAPATTEPVVVKGVSCYRLWAYEIAGRANRMLHQLLVIPA